LEEFVEIVIGLEDFLGIMAPSPLERVGVRLHIVRIRIEGLMDCRIG
jgi:hypothetical protein